MSLIGAGTLQLGQDVGLARLAQELAKPLGQGIARLGNDATRALRGKLDAEVDAAREARVPLPRGGDLQVPGDAFESRALRRAGQRSKTGFF